MVKKYLWMPIAFFLVGGIGFYVTFGLEWNAWKENIPNLAIYAVICLALGWALKKKDDIKNSREQ